ncbi:MAG TPA: glycosyltransferase family 4 protein [Desulfatiglandales bacterium]|nr:glycosyltransferase family 4 protein [Desulfatiglandales bacterium]
MEKTLDPAGSTPQKRLKIAILVRNFVKTGGMERYCVEVARRLALRHDVHIFAQEWRWNGDEKITFHRIPKFLTKPSFLSLLLFSYFTHKKVDDSFDIIHSHERVTHFDALTVHCPCFRTYITDEKSLLKRMLIWLSIALSPRKMAYLWLENRQFSYNSKRMLIAVSDKVKKNVRANYLLPDECFGLAFPGVDRGLKNGERSAESRETERKRLGINKDDLVILFVGTEFRRKGLDALLRGFAMIVRDDMKLVIAGGGEKKRRYTRLVKELGIAGHVIFLGLVEDMENIYAISDIYILPTLSEPAGMAPIEAMAAGIPTIISSSRYAGSTERIKDGEAIILENPDQPENIADALSRLMDEGLRKELGAKGRELARHLTWDQTTKDTLDVYYRILELKEK